MSLDAFTNILLEDTFVLAWHQGPGSLTFHVLASLMQTHPAASVPAVGDWACYRPGIIQFFGVSTVRGLLKQHSVKGATDAAGEVDYGCIDALAFVQPSGYRIVGEFGDVSVTAAGVSIFLAATA
jgi:hypothetical protein